MPAPSPAPAPLPSHVFPMIRQSLEAKMPSPMLLDAVQAEIVLPEPSPNPDPSLL